MNKFKKFIKIILKIFMFLILIIAVSSLGVYGAVNYLRWQADVRESGENKTGINAILVPEKKLEPIVSGLFMGVNGHLTDFIMLGQYNPNTREISLLSIPRDTKVTGTVDGKINSAYMGKYPEKTIEKVKEITGIEAEYYVVFDTKILRNIVDELDGVTVNVPINMNYDDPEQNLYIHLKKGEQKLTGKQAEQFVRFRKNNNGTGYSNGDVGRIAAQQQFLKALFNRLLEPQNILKVNKLAAIVIDGTKTNVTWNIALNYLDDVATFKSDRIRMEILPGEGGYGTNGLSYYFYDEEETKTLIEDLFFNDVDEGNVEEGNTVEVSANIGNSDDNSNKIRLELLNAGANSKMVNLVIESLNNSGYYVAKTGNYSSTETELSRIIYYSDSKQEELEQLKDKLGISQTYNNMEENTVDFTVILGPLYKPE